MNKAKALCLFIMCLAPFLFGCETSDDTTAPTVDQPAELSGTLGAAGGTLTSSDGRLSLTIPPGALAAETDLSIRESDTADVDPAFGDFSVHALLEMEPANLTLSAPAEISFSFDAVPVPVAAGKADDPQEYPVLLGIAMTAEGNVVPNQDITYDLDPTADSNFTITVESMAWSQLVVGNPATPPAKDNDFPKLTLELEFKLSEEETVPLVEDQASRFELLATLRGGGGLTLDGPIMGSLPGQWDFYCLMLAGDPWQPEEVEEVTDNQLKCRWVVELYPATPGETRFAIGLAANLDFMDMPEMDLPLPEGSTLGQTAIHLRSNPVRILVREPDPPAPSLSIATGMTAPRGLNASFQSLDDPAPLGTVTDPWLYVAALEGVNYYRLVKNQSHAIVSTELVGTITNPNLVGVLPVSGQGDQIARCLFMHEEGHYNYTTYWNRASGEYGMTLMHAVPTEDATAYGTTNISPGFCFAERTRIQILEFDSVTGLFVGPPVLVGILPTNNFPGLTGDMVSCIVHDTTRALLVITSTGQIWFHARQDVEDDGVNVGSTQSSPRQIRGSGDFYAVSNAYASTLTTFLWSGGGSISNILHTSVSAGPHGIDVRRLPNTSYLVVSTSAINNTYILSQYSSAGNHIRNRMYDVPETGRAPKYGIFVGLSSVPYVALSCMDSGTVELIPVDLSEFN